MRRAYARLKKRGEAWQLQKLSAGACRSVVIGNPLQLPVVGALPVSLLIRADAKAPSPGQARTKPGTTVEGLSPPVSWAGMVGSIYRGGVAGHARTWPSAA